MTGARTRRPCGREAERGVEGLDLDFAGPDRVDHGLGPVHRIQLTAGIGEETIYGALADPENDRNTPGRLALRGPQQALALPMRQQAIGSRGGARARNGYGLL